VAYHDEHGSLVTDHASIARHYAEWRLWVDLATTVPFDWIVLGAMGLQAEKTQTARYISLLRLLRLGRCYRLKKVCGAAAAQAPCSACRVGRRWPRGGPRSKLHSHWQALVLKNSSVRRCGPLTSRACHYAVQWTVYLTNAASLPLSLVTIARWEGRPRRGNRHSFACKCALARGHNACAGAHASTPCFAHRPLAPPLPPGPGTS
jgi:hypothetical protein